MEEGEKTKVRRGKIKRAEGARRERKGKIKAKGRRGGGGDLFFVKYIVIIHKAIAIATVAITFLSKEGRKEEGRNTEVERMNGRRGEDQSEKGGDQARGRSEAREEDQNGCGRATVDGVHTFTRLPLKNPRLPVLLAVHLRRSRTAIISSPERTRTR